MRDDPERLLNAASPLFFDRTRFVRGSKLRERRPDGGLDCSSANKLYF